MTGPGHVEPGGRALVTEIGGREIENEDLVNLPNWLLLRIRLEEDDWLSPDRVELLSYRQELGLREALLHRTLRLRDSAGRILRWQERRLVSMADCHGAALAVTLSAENWSGRLTVCSGLDGRVIFAGTLRTRVDLLALAATCDVGLALMPTSSSDLNERTMLGASNKAFDYLACGLALVVSNADDWRATYADAGYGRTCIPESTESLADAFAWCYEHPEDVRIMGERGRRRILADWNYDAAFAPVLERLVGAQAPARLGTVAVDAAARG